MGLYGNIFNESIEFELNEPHFNRSITRNFRSVYTLTVINGIEGSATSYGDILFKDPTTDNEFHPYSADNGGFVNEEAFLNLSEDVFGLENQKYAVKAKPTILHDGRTYYYYIGDFGTTAQDLLITDDTTLTANFKGTQLSSQTNALSGSGQRKIIRTPMGNLHMVYESMGKVWYERSTNNGETWTLENNQNPLSEEG